MISIIIPFYNEQPVLDQLYDSLSGAAASWDERYEVIIVNDGSTDGSEKHLYDLYRCDSRWRIINFSRNFGQQMAISAGLRYARGDCAIIIDADLQDPPEQLHRFISKWREGYDIVYGIRTNRKENRLKKSCYKLFYKLLGWLADIDIPPDAGDFCLMDRKVVDQLNKMPEHHRFMRGLRAWVGFRHIGLEYERNGRAAGESKYSFQKLFRLAIDGILSFSKLPLRFMLLFGLSIMVLSIFISIIALIKTIGTAWFAADFLPDLPGTLIILMLLGGIHLTFLGIIGEYVGKVYEEVRKRPLWIIQDMFGFEQASTTKPSYKNRTKHCKKFTKTNI